MHLLSSFTELSASGVGPKSWSHAFMPRDTRCLGRDVCRSSVLDYCQPYRLQSSGAPARASELWEQIRVVLDEGRHPVLPLYGCGQAGSPLTAQHTGPLGLRNRKAAFLHNDMVFSTSFPAALF
jgi:hypothetical protein